MPKKSKKPISKPISEERILQLSNDVSQDIRSGSVEEWRSVAAYWRSQHDRLAHKISAIRPSIAALVMGRRILGYANSELATWLDKQTPEDP